MNVAEQFGKNLVRCRKAADLSQEETAVRASLHRTEISQIERGLRTPRIDTLVKLMGALEADANELLKAITWEPGETRPGNFRSTQAATTLRENGFNGPSRRRV